MFERVSTKNAGAVEAEVQRAYFAVFPNGNPRFVPDAFHWVKDSFEGKTENYQAIDARYHDFEHTLQVTLCMARLLRRRHEIGAEPKLTQKVFELGLLAILLHDTGYLKTKDDTEGTGAKYTIVHVSRSTDFAARLLAKKNFSLSEIQSVQNMIRCTGVDATLSIIPFQSELEREVGFALGTADLLGQMAADDYVEKLPVLYEEFHEASEHAEGPKANLVSMFSSAQDLMQKTPDFWEKYVKLKLDRDFGGVHKFFNDPYPHGPNWYLDQIEANIEKLRRQLALTAT
jgi:hypothetical protein